MSAYTPWPVRPCEPWCVDGKGHLEESPGDRACTWRFLPVDTSLRDPVKMGEGAWVLDRIEVTLRREAAGQTVVQVYDEGPAAVDLDLTPAEALRLRDALDEALFAVGAQ